VSDKLVPLTRDELQKMLDESSPWGILGYEKALYLDELTDDVIQVVTQHVPRKQSPMSRNGFGISAATRFRSATPSASARP